MTKINFLFFSSQTERRIILIGNLGAGKSHCGNGLLGKKSFESRQCWSLVTTKCEHDFAIINSIKYQVYDTPGMNLTEELKKIYDVKTDIRRSLYGSYPGFHAIVLVLSATERITSELFELLDDLLDENAYEYMIIIIAKLENDEKKLNAIIKDSKEFQKLQRNCNNRIVIFGNNPERIPTECVNNFHDILENLVTKNAKSGKHCYTHKYSKTTKKLFKKDYEDYLRDNPYVDKNEAFDIVRCRVAEGLFPRHKEHKRHILSKSCSIS